MTRIKTAFVIVVLIVLTFYFFSSACVSIVFSDSTVEMSGGPITVYIVEFEGVGGFRAANHSAVVEGAKQATFINIERKFSFDNVNVCVNATYELVHDWQTYKQLVENANKTIIVNTHDEILPVPDGYAREEWIAVIADFLLQRWGTWVHTGGLPFRIVHYENGTTEEWLEGFEKLMEHTHQNIEVKNPPDLPLLIEANSHAFSSLGDFSVFFDLHAHSLSDFTDALLDFADGFDYCLKFGRNDVDPSMMHIYSINHTTDLNVYASSAALRFSNATDRYGVFIYSSQWKFANAFSNYISDYNCGLGMGAIPTAAAIWCEAGYAAKKIVEAKAASLKDETMLQKANDAFDAGNYKQAVIYAEKAMALSQPNVLPAIILTAVAGTVVATIAIIHNRNNKNKKKQGRN